MKPTSHYKMNKETKRLLARFIDPHARGDFKRFAIQCELDAQKAKFAKVDKSLKD
jgi:hypothetical protein